MSNVYNHLHPVFQFTNFHWSFYLILCHEYAKEKVLAKASRRSGSKRIFSFKVFLLCSKRQKQRGVVKLGGRTPTTLVQYLTKSYFLLMFRFLFLHKFPFETLRRKLHKLCRPYLFVSLSWIEKRIGAVKYSALEHY